MGRKRTSEEHVPRPLKRGRRPGHGPGAADLAEFPSAPDSNSARSAAGRGRTSEEHGPRPLKQSRRPGHGPGLRPTLRGSRQLLTAPPQDRPWAGNARARSTGRDRLSKPQTGPRGRAAADLAGFASAPDSTSARSAMGRERTSEEHGPRPLKRGRRPGRGPGAADLAEFPSAPNSNSARSAASRGRTGEGLGVGLRRHRARGGAVLEVGWARPAGLGEAGCGQGCGGQQA
ncbi:hypothetical protein BJ973_004843 [Actinoplanes tereljensis]